MREISKASIRRLGIFGFIIAAFFSLTLSSCEKAEGPGGTGSISGTMLRELYNDDFSLKIEEGPAVDEEIFILYGNDESLGDREFTSLTGAFSFNYLRPGKYTVYYFTEDSATILDENIEKILEIQLGDGENKKLGELKQLKTADWNDGDGTIRGVVKLINYTNESTWPNLIIKDITFAQEQEIYLTYGNHTFYDERIRTQNDGSFEFNKLIPGAYKIFLYSEDVSGGTEMITISRNATITEREQLIDVGEIIIEKH